MIQLLFQVIITLLCSYLILVVILKFRIKIQVFFIIGLCLYMVEVAFFIYRGTKVPEGTTPVTPEEIVNSR